MRRLNFLNKIKDYVEIYLPMTLSSFVIFLFILYFLYIVGRTTLGNYNSNKQIDAEKVKISEIEEELKFMQNQINYYQTPSFKEKEAREKLGYKASGESVLSLPLDITGDDKENNQDLGEIRIKTPNYRLWWSYFFR